jgi:acetylornithine deacetylase/succinyl-diaminopimelate desuccinylase-like protein
MAGPVDAAGVLARGDDAARAGRSVPSGETLARWVSDMVQIPSVNPLHGGPHAGVVGEAAFAMALADWFTEVGASRVELDDVLDGRPNVYGWFPGRTDRLVVLDVHTDTVTVENMIEPPFDGRIEDGHVHGRGALDTKASLGVICALLEQWRRDGLRPGPTVLVAGTISEEAGGLLGASAFRRWAQREGLQIDQLVISEPTQCRPVHGHKGAIGVRVTVLGESAHSSTPDLGRNAVYAAARVVAAIEAYHGELVVRPATTAVGTGTATVSMISGGVAPNVVPDRCTLVIGRRLVPGEDPAVEYDALCDIVRNASILPVEIEALSPSPDGAPGSAAFYQPPDATLLSVLAASCATTPTTAPFGTNALRYQDFAAEVCVFGPGNIDDAHRSTERVAIADLERTARAFTAWLDPG